MKTEPTAATAGATTPSATGIETARDPLREQAERLKQAVTEPPALRRLFIGVALAFLFLLVAAPLLMVFIGAFAGGWSALQQALSDADTWAALRLTLLMALLSVPLNLTFGIAAAWAIARFQFRGKTLLLTLIDLPVSVSPVVAGLLFVLLFGKQGWFGPALQALDMHVLFAVPGMVLATLFITFPIAARELIPLMMEQGSQEEEAARTLGANGWQIFFQVTLPNIRWGVMYAVVMTSARAMGEFGAVSIVSGHIRGLTTTLPLQVEMLYNEFRQVDAFAAAGLLCVMSFMTLLLKKWVERKRREA
jgi:sulfate/thiosulfate transport system permease protein